MATTNFSLTEFPYPFSLTNQKIGIATAEWNNHITHLLRDGAKQYLLQQGIATSSIVDISVPGAFELPTAAQMLFTTGCDAVICLGCIIKGDTPHFDFVGKGATDGILRVGLDYKKPCIYGVLTTLNEEQAISRAGGNLGNKGTEAAITALWMLAAAQHIKTLS